MARLEIKYCNMILKEKQQTYHHGKIDKYEYLTGEEIIPSDKEEQ